MLLILYSFRAFISLRPRPTFERWQGAWLLSIYIAYVVLQYTLNLRTVGIYQKTNARLRGRTS